MRFYINVVFIRLLVPVPWVTLTIIKWWSTYNWITYFHYSQYIKYSNTYVQWHLSSVPSIAMKPRYPTLLKTNVFEYWNLETNKLYLFNHISIIYILSRSNNTYSHIAYIPITVMSDLHKTRTAQWWQREEESSEESWTETASLCVLCSVECTLAEH